MVGHYLLFNRNCEQAIETYVNAFEATVTEVRKYSDMPQNPAFPIAEADLNLVLHARLQIGDTELMCADSGSKLVAGDHMYVTITTKDIELVKRAWHILKENGTIYMDLTPSFFASLHGSLRDQYGINWMFTAMQE